MPSLVTLRRKLRLLLTQRFFVHEWDGIKGTDNVLPAKRKNRPGLYVLVIITLNFACCAHPTHENRQVTSGLLKAFRFGRLWHSTVQFAVTLRDIGNKVTGWSQGLAKFCSLHWEK